MVDINALQNLLPIEYQKLYCFIFNESVGLGRRKERVLSYLSDSFEQSNIIKNIDGHSAHSLIIHFINIDERLIHKKYKTHEEQKMHFVELLFHEYHHAYQVTYEGEINTKVDTLYNPLELAADSFSKEQMIVNKVELSKLLGINEEKIECFANQIRKNKGATV